MPRLRRRERAALRHAVEDAARGCAELNAVVDRLERDPKLARSAPAPKVARAPDPLATLAVPTHEQPRAVTLRQRAQPEHELSRDL